MYSYILLFYDDFVDKMSIFSWVYFCMCAYVKGVLTFHAISLFKRTVVSFFNAK